MQGKLQDEKVLRQRKEDCEALASKVNLETARVISEKEIKQTNEELAILKVKQTEVQAKFDLRQRQFQLLIHSIVELTEVLSTDIE